MKVVYSPTSIPDWVAANELSSCSSDECFSPHDLALALGISIEEAHRRVNDMNASDLCARVEPADPAAQSPIDRWCLIRHSLTVGREYEVLGIEADMYRLLNDPDAKPYGNDPVLFAPQLFAMTDATEPSSWINEYGEEGERYAYPPEWHRPGFFEDYHDGVAQVRAQFWSDLHRYYSATALERT